MTHNDPVCPAPGDPATSGLHFGVYPAQVTGLNDPEDNARIRVRLPWAADQGNDLELWARCATLSAGDGSGVYFLPDVGSEVLIAFEAGDMRRAYVIGSLWNGGNRPPETMDGGSENSRRSITTPAGARILMDDEAGEVRVETADGHTLDLSDGDGSVSLTHANGSRIRIKPGGEIEISAGATVNIAAAKATINAASCDIRGIVRCETLVANTSVISPSYTPGSGNIW